MHRKINYFLLFISLFLSGCSDGSQTFVYDKKILDMRIECMRLTLIPPSTEMQTALHSLYDFKQECNYTLEVSYKNSITCNSNQNADKKAYGLPKSYLRMEIKKDGYLQYTYYKDLNENISSRDIEKGFATMQADLHF